MSRRGCGTTATAIAALGDDMCKHYHHLLHPRPPPDFMWREARANPAAGATGARKACEHTAEEETEERHKTHHTPTRRTGRGRRGRAEKQTRADAAAVRARRPSVALEIKCVNTAISFYNPGHPPFFVWRASRAVPPKGADD